MNPLIDLLHFGQSYWLDNLTRNKITSGELRRRVEEQGLRGITSNPSIFNKAITSSNDYDEQIKSLVRSGQSPQQIYDSLTVADVRDACDVLKPVFDQSEGTDGFVSLEVSPYLARDTNGTMVEARRLYAEVGRANCFIKIPGTKEGIPAIEQMLYEGININITLLFSIDRYVEVAQAYIRAIERRMADSKDVRNILSVASIFISRIDVLMDQVLAQYVNPLDQNVDSVHPETLYGLTGIATARLSYLRFKELFVSPQWKKLEAHGAHVQRPLWASTSNKDPMYHDLRYVEPLIGKDTVNTLPDETIAAFAGHGIVEKDSIEQHVAEAKKLFDDIKSLGINIDFITQQLENEGVQKFKEAYDKLISNLAAKRLELLKNNFSFQTINAGKLEAEIKSVYTSMDEKQISGLLFALNPYLWKSEPDQITDIRQRLGWLTLANDFEQKVKELTSFVLSIKEEGFTHAVLLGMGGSSLCSEVARETFGSSKGYPELFVLDNTEPEAILDLENKIDLGKSLFIVASKSGNTEETLDFFRYFYNQLEKKNKKNPGDNFVAITDAATPLVKMAEQYHFRTVFINPSDLGGRYSVLSDFGLVPMALMGIDIHHLLTSAKQMEISCNDIPAAVNPGVSLGIALGIAQRHGRDKVTFVLSSSISSFGYWVEQLLAESTGKEGKGLIPVNGEIPGTPEEYGQDRIFIHMYLSTDDNNDDILKIQNLEKAGHPVVRINIADKIELGGEYFRWEVAVAVAGIIMKINSFDQPNVEESKKNTKQLLEYWQKEGSFSEPVNQFKFDKISIYNGQQSNNNKNSGSSSVGEFANNFTSQAGPNDYIALLPYFMLTESRQNILQSWRKKMRDELKIATTLLVGPRYLHSTGQLHKGGPTTGLFIILIGDEEKDIPIPDSKFGFGTLHTAQALGDFQSLDNKNRRVIFIRLGNDIDDGLRRLMQSAGTIAQPQTTQVEAR